MRPPFVLALAYLKAMAALVAVAFLLQTAFWLLGLKQTLLVIIAGLEIAASPLVLFFAAINIRKDFV